MSQLLRVVSTTYTFSFQPPTPIVLDPNKDYEIALRAFHSYNSIPNIENNKFYYCNDKNKWQNFAFLDGCYEIADIEEYIQKKLGADNELKPESIFSLKPNHNTLQCQIFSKYRISFKQPDSLGTVLGFSPAILNPGRIHSSNLPVRIIKVSSIRF
uniref:Uncharacterized protein LOC114348326 n=1 Tax=Diabrotica virgifera virgifera TaxID=50390 RepID=A0A6P7HAK8_DIAVI